MNEKFYPHTKRESAPLAQDFHHSRYGVGVYTVESVTSGHPDKICDQISDAILDAYLTGDSQSRVAVETFGSHGLLVIGGEVTSRADVDAAQIARDVYRDIGHEDDLKIITNIIQQSPDIAQGVDTGGAGDQGIMYGYACDETPEFLPKGVVLAHRLTQGLENLRRGNSEFKWLGPDGKAQVTLKDGKVNPHTKRELRSRANKDHSRFGVGVKTVLVSAQHSKFVTQEAIRTLLTERLIKPVVGDISGVEILVNPTGKFIIGGFTADTGLTGRKIMVDTYGGFLPHGGGAFSGKDATKVDRSAAYMARFAAKNIVANGLAKECLVSVAYAIGRAEPLMVAVKTDNGKDFFDLVLKNFDFRPKAIIERLDLRRPIYKATAAYGHFGKPDLPWEQIISL